MELQKYIETLYSKAVSTGELGHEVCELRSHSKISEFIMLYCMLSQVSQHTIGYNIMNSLILEWELLLRSRTTRVIYID